MAWNRPKCLCPPKMKSGKVAGHQISGLRAHNIMHVVARRALTKKAQLPEKPGLG